MAHRVTSELRPGAVISDRYGNRMEVLTAPEPDPFAVPGSGNMRMQVIPYGQEDREDYFWKLAGIRETHPVGV